MMGTWAHDAAVSAGVRLLSVNRPGYGGSTPIREPSLLRVGRDTAAMAARLGLDAYTVFGLSGGGPFAVATAVADPSHVRALGIIGGIGPWLLLDGPSKDPEGTHASPSRTPGITLARGSACTEMSSGRTSRLAELDDAGRVDGMLTDIADGSQLLDDERYRALWPTTSARSCRTSMDPRSTTCPGGSRGTSTRVMSLLRRCSGTASWIPRVHLPTAGGTPTGSRIRTSSSSPARGTSTSSTGTGRMC